MVKMGRHDNLIPEDTVFKISVHDSWMTVGHIGLCLSSIGHIGNCLPVVFVVHVILHFGEHWTDLSTLVTFEIVVFAMFIIHVTVQIDSKKPDEPVMQGREVYRDLTSRTYQSVYMSGDSANAVPH